MGERHKVLIIDDENATALLTKALANRYAVLTASDGEAGLAQALATHPDLIMVDVMLSRKLNGFEVCRRLRSNPAMQTTVVFILSAQNDDKLRIDAFSANADDFIVKSIDPNELLVRIQARLRRFADYREAKSTLICGNLTMDMNKLEARIKNTKIPFSVLELSLLKYFVENKDHVLSRENIIRSVWRNGSISERAIDTHVAVLRKKLLEFDYQISTRYGAGYVLEKKQ